VSGAALIAMIRDFHKDCGGCLVEQLCDEYEAVLNGRAVMLTQEQSDEMRDYLGRIIEPTGAIFSQAHDIYDDAYHFLSWFPLDREASGERGDS